MESTASSASIFNEAHWNSRPNGYHELKVQDLQGSSLLYFYKLPQQGEGDRTIDYGVAISDNFNEETVVLSSKKTYILDEALQFFDQQWDNVHQLALLITSKLRA